MSISANAISSQPISAYITPSSMMRRRIFVVPVIPMFMTMQEWADETTRTLYDVAAVPRLEAQGEQDWADWARLLVGTPAIAAFNPPDPELFADDWRTWAIRFNEALTA
jgi:hypothetical protein